LVTVTGCLGSGIGFIVYSYFERKKLKKEFELFKKTVLSVKTFLNW